MTLKEYRENGPYAWPGGYPIYAIMDDGSLLCHKCCCEEPVHEGGEADGWRFEDAGVYWEGRSDYCSHCNTVLESVYGDPDEED
jgi:hypothetical protein